MAMKTNPHIKLGNDDYLYHLDLETKKLDFKQEFHDVKFVCMGGSSTRMFTFAKFMNEKLKTGQDVPRNYAEGTDRYCLYKAGPVLIANHGIGTASLSIVLNEIFKLLFYAECKDVIFLRLGTCGGIGVEAGTVVISDNAVNGELEPIFSFMKLGTRIDSHTTVDSDLAKEIYTLSSSQNNNFRIVLGTTCSVDCFYEAQGRLDGAFCNYSAQDKQDFIKRLSDKGVVNMEMEGLGLFSYCHRAGFKAAMIAVAIVNRLVEDVPTANGDEIKEWESRPFDVAFRFIQSRLN